jgi:hypothetical protein
MKYLKFYEAFKSKSISKTLRFINDKISERESKKFLNALKNFMSYSDFPIDKISDDNLKYMRAKNALQLRTKDKVSNRNELELIKFWFSLEKGYLGYTGTGNREYEFTSKGRTNATNGLRPEERFTQDQIDLIVRDKELKGEIWPVTDYNNLKTGDLVIGYFDYDRNIYKFDTAIIYVDNSPRYYALQNVSDGSTPYDSGWSRFGKRYSWFLYEPHNEMGPDHRCLHYYRPTSEDLHYKQREESEEVDDEEDNVEDPLTWNLPLDGLSIKKWSGYYDSISSSEDIKEADFAIVLYYDKMTNPNVDAPYFEPVSSTKISRAKEREGALALMTDDQVRKMNIEKYVSRLSSDLEISPDDLKNLGKILIKSILGEFSLITLRINRNDNLGRLSSICHYLYSMMSGDDVEHYALNVKSSYKTLNERYYKDLTYSLEIKSLLKGTTFENTFNKILEIGKLISDLIRKSDAKSIDDVLILYQKIQSIRNFTNLDQNKLQYSIGNIMGEFFSRSSVVYYINEYQNSYTDENMKKDIEKLERIEKYIKSIL